MSKMYDIGFQRYRDYKFRVCGKSSTEKNACKKREKNYKIYIFKKPLTMPFRICRNVCKSLNNLMCNEEKLKM